MTRVAIINSESLMGKELKLALSGRRDLWDEVRLLTAIPAEVGTVTEGVVGAAFVQELSDETAEGLDVVIVCPGPLPATESPGFGPATILYLCPSHPMTGATSIVAGVNADAAQPGTALSSPHPAVVALAHLLHPLSRHGLQGAACWVAQPSSMFGQQGIEELMEQTRAILSFQSEHPVEVFGSQLAFNLLQVPDSGDELGNELIQVLGVDANVTVQLMQAPVFHGITLAAQVRLNPGIDANALREDLLADSFIDSVDNWSTMGPIDVAGRETLLLGAIEASARYPGLFSLSGVLDNLVAGGAGNAVAIIEALSARRH